MTEETKKARTNSGCIVGVVAVGVVIFAALLLSNLGSGQAERTSRNCSTAADTFQDRADALMVRYITAHRSGGDKQAVRDAMLDLSEPACAAGARGAVFEWFVAVDKGDQQGMQAAEARYFRSLR